MYVDSGLVLLCETDVSLHEVHHVNTCILLHQLWGTQSILELVTNRRVKESQDRVQSVTSLNLEINLVVTLLKGNLKIVL